MPILAGLGAALLGGAKAAGGAAAAGGKGLAGALGSLKGPLSKFGASKFGQGMMGNMGKGFGAHITNSLFSDDEEEQRMMALQQMMGGGAGASPYPTNLTSAIQGGFS